MLELQQPVQIRARVALINTILALIYIAVCMLCRLRPTVLEVNADKNCLREKVSGGSWQAYSAGQALEEMLLGYYHTIIMMVFDAHPQHPVSHNLHVPAALW